MVSKCFHWTLVVTQILVVVGLVSCRGPEPILSYMGYWVTSYALNSCTLVHSPCQPGKFLKTDQNCVTIDLKTLGRFPSCNQILTPSRGLQGFLWFVPLLASQCHFLLFTGHPPLWPSLTPRICQPSLFLGSLCLLFPLPSEMSGSFQTFSSRLS